MIFFISVSQTERQQGQQQLLFCSCVKHLIFLNFLQMQKEHYLNYRRAYFKDSTDIFSYGSKDLSKTGKC